MNPVLAATGRQSTQSSTYLDRVDLGGCPPRSPTDPYVPTLEHTVPQVMVSLRATMDDTRIGKRETFYQCVELRPAKFTLAVAAVKPLVPTSLNFKLEALQRNVVSRDPVVCVVPVELLAQLGMLLADWPVPIVTTPLSDAPHCSTKAARRGLAFDNPCSPT